MSNKDRATQCFKNELTSEKKMNTISKWGWLLCCAYLTAKSSEKMCVKVREGQFSRAHQNPEIS